MERRRFILLSITGTAAVSLPLSHCGTESYANHPAFLESSIGKERSRELGKIYIEQNPAEADRKKLLELISRNLNSSSESAVNLSIQNEFSSGKIVIINGWILSVTEARQSALLFLNS